MEALTLSKSNQIKAQLELLESQREQLLDDLEKYEPGSAEFADIAQRLAVLRSAVDVQGKSLESQLEAEKTQAERDAEAEAKRMAELQAKAKAESAAISRCDELLERWGTLAADLQQAIFDWNAFTKTDQYQLLREINALPGVAGAACGTANWECRVPHPKRRNDGGWSLFLEKM